MPKSWGAAFDRSMMIKKLVIFGVGLIGGSFALALKEAQWVQVVVGFGRNPSNLKSALAAGVIDEIGTDVPAALAGADMVLLALPVGQIAPVLGKIGPWLADSTVVTDTGSTKTDIIAAAFEHLTHKQQFVPAHPVAGAELSGVSAARANLFQQKKIILTPTQETSPAASALVGGAWRACGGKISYLSAAEHDALFAAVSHLPHVLAFALVDYIAGREEAAALFDFAAGGFRDFTRIASSNPEMWRDICLANQTSLLAELSAYADCLTHIQSALAAGDGAELLKIFSNSRSARNKWLQGGGPD